MCRGDLLLLRVCALIFLPLCLGACGTSFVVENSTHREIAELEFFLDDQVSRSIRREGYIVGLRAGESRELKVRLRGEGCIVIRGRFRNHTRFGNQCVDYYYANMLDRQHIVIDGDGGIQSPPLRRK